MLLHDENEAHRENYSGFHQWNFCAETGHFTIWNRETRISVNDALDNIAEITVDDSGYERGYDKPVFVSLKKKSTSEAEKLLCPAISENVTPSSNLELAPIGEDRQ